MNRDWTREFAFSLFGAMPAAILLLIFPDQLSPWLCYLAGVVGGFFAGRLSE